MLTSTYTLVALSVEQTTVRNALQSVMRALHALPDDGGSLAAGAAADLCAELRRAVDNCHWRKLDKFLVPALRRHTRAADDLLAELEQLSRTAIDCLAAAEACLDSGPHGVSRARFAGAVERCVAVLRQRLEREEDELFPLARSAVRGEAWFAIANQLLAHDAVARERQGAGRHGFGRREAIGQGHMLREPPGLHPPGPEFGRQRVTLSTVH